MGIFVKRRDGIEYLYVLAGRSQYFLGRRDDLDNLNLQNLRKAAQTIDKNFERTFAKYLDGLQERAEYMAKDEKQKYMTQQLGKISSMLEQKTSTVK